MSLQLVPQALPVVLRDQGQSVHVKPSSIEDLGRKRKGKPVALQPIHQFPPVVPRDRLIRLPEVEVVVGVRKSAIYAMMAEDKFPRPVRLSARMVAWPESAVLAWVQSRIAEAQQGVEVSQ